MLRQIHTIISRINCHVGRANQLLIKPPQLINGWRPAHRPMSPSLTCPARAIPGGTPPHHLAKMGCDCDRGPHLSSQPAVGKTKLPSLHEEVRSTSPHQTRVSRLASRPSPPRPRGRGSRSDRHSGHVARPRSIHRSMQPRWKSCAQLPSRRTSSVATSASRHTMHVVVGEEAAVVSSSASSPPWSPWHDEAHPPLGDGDGDGSRSATSWAYSTAGSWAFTSSGRGASADDGRRREPSSNGKRQSPTTASISSTASLMTLSALQKVTTGFGTARQ